MRKLYAVILTVLICSIAYTDLIRIDLEFEEAKVIKIDRFSRIYIENTRQLGSIGKPSLPYRAIKMVLPEGEVIVGLEVELSEPETMSGVGILYPVQPPQRISDANKPGFVEPDDDVYLRNRNYPEQEVINLQTHFMSGFGLGFFAISPIQYNPVTQDITFWHNIRVIIETNPDKRASAALNYLHYDEEIVNFVSRNVLNPELISTYQNIPNRDEAIDYLIITGEDYIGDWNDLALLYHQRGYTTEIYPVEEINTNYSGIDLQEKIRNFLIQKYEDNSIRYVLLAGDTDIIPHRGFYGIVNENSPDPTIDYDIPADMYYSCLDRGPGIGTGPDWNNNNNDKWGEQNESDLIPEFAIGRVAFNNSIEISNFIQKVERYMNTPNVEELDKALFLGEDLGWNVWGGDYMDEMIGGSDTFGHTTVGIPLDWEINTLYDRDSYWSQGDLYNQFNTGPNLVNHLGHSSTTYTMKLSNSDVNTYNITNDGNENNLFIVFTQGCYGGAFDNRTSNGSYTSDCITEKFVSIPTGTVSMISHSRFGWGSTNNTDGASQFYNREFIDAFFGEEIYNLGLALNDAKVDAIPFMSNVMYWVCYETNLQGDPALMVWTDNPGELIVNHPQEIITGSESMQVTCSEYNADVVVLMDDQVIGTGNTGINGETTVYFNTPPEELIDLQINVLKHNFLTYHGSITVIPAEGPYIVCNTADYSEEGDYIDGSIQSLDLVNVHITLDNIGLEPTIGYITALLTTESNYAEILQDFTETNPLPALESQTIENAFQVELLTGIPDNTFITFTINITADGNNWQSTIYLNVNGPEVVFSDFTMNVISGDDLILDPGETAEIYLTYLNEGSGYSYDFVTTLFSYDEYISISGYDVIPHLDPESYSVTLSPFTIEIDAECPEEYYLQIELFGLDVLGSTLINNFVIPIGISGYNFENGDTNWQHYSLSTGYQDEWHLSDVRNHTEQGTYSMKCGGSGYGNYANFVHAGLESPEILISAGSFISFYHWMDAEIDNGTEAWDGGLIEISINGNEFQSIVPVGGYPYTIVSNPDSPFPGGTPVFAGNIQWEEVLLDVSEYSGSVKIRFVFGTDGAVTQEGWYIDDLKVIENTANEPEVIIPANFDLEQNYPNPFNPQTVISFLIPEASHVRIDIFNSKGQLVNKLVNGDFSAGSHQITWQGEDSRGKKVSSGIYFYRMESSKFTSCKKMILLK